MGFGNFNYNQDTYLAQIARGNIEGAEVFQAFGSTSTAGGSDLLIFPNGAYTFSYPDQTTGETVTFVSTDDEDAVGGTGISKIHIHYLDADLNEQFAIVTLTGTTPVTGQLSGVRFIQCMHVYDEDSVGTDLAATGDILAYRAGAVTPEDEVFSIILATDTRCSSSIRMVPKDKVLMLYGAAASSVSTTADAYSNIRIFATEFGHQKYNTKFIKMPIASLGLQNGNSTYNFPVPVKLTEGTVLGGKFDANKSCVVTMTLFGTIENAGA
jgi:hypothetical protein